MGYFVYKGNNEGVSENEFFPIDTHFPKTMSVSFKQLNLETVTYNRFCCMFFYLFQGTFPDSSICITQ
jgi:hypothetical protein